MPLDAAKRGTLDYKDPPLRAIVAANDVYQAGYHNGDPGGLDAIDPDLATANIKNGITIFGKVGSADVHDISDATAVEAEVLAPETFYAVGGGRRTGTMPTVALAPGSSAYPAGYHAGDGGGLPAIDADLVTANIKNGITIFNIPGDVDVRDVSDANALVAEVMNGRTFYAVGGAIKTGTLPTRTLNPANENVLAGYYAGTTLSTVEIQLAAANILSGVNIFGFVGVATVQDIADADAVLADVKAGKHFYSVTGGRKTGNLATVAIAADNNAYPAGYHAGDGGGLSAIDVNLAAANILSGVNIFGFVGVATVRDIADADALVGQVLNPATFYSVTGARKTGTMATVALAPGSNAYPAGYHVGAANLTAVDGDLVTANIKNGITIFNVAGHVDVRNVSDANALVGEVMAGRTFYAVGGARKTGTLATVALAADNSAYPAGYHAGAASLQAVDAHLTPANIALGVNIFGYVGTLAPAALAEDVEGDADLAGATDSSATHAHVYLSIPGDDEITLATKNLAFDASSIAFAVGIASCSSNVGDSVKLRLYMGGVLMQESGWVDWTDSWNFVLRDFKALSGSQDCILKAFNDWASPAEIQFFGKVTTSDRIAAIGVGSVKLA